MTSFKEVEIPLPTQVCSLCFALCSRNPQHPLGKFFSVNSSGKSSYFKLSFMHSFQKFWLLRPHTPLEFPVAFHGVNMNRYEYEPQIIPLWPLSWSCFLVDPSSTPATFLNSQLVCLLPIGILNHVMFICIICFIVCFHWPWKAPLREWSSKVFKSSEENKTVINSCMVNNNRSIKWIELTFAVQKCEGVIALWLVCSPLYWVV